MKYLQTASHAAGMEFHQSPKNFLRVVFDDFSLFYYMFYRKTRLFLRFFKIPRHLVGAGELYSIKE